jgi:hypothetical protein
MSPVQNSGANAPGTTAKHDVTFDDRPLDIHQRTRLVVTEGVRRVCQRKSTIVLCQTWVGYPPETPSRTRSGYSSELPNDLTLSPEVQVNDLRCGSSILRFGWRCKLLIVSILRAGSPRWTISQLLIREAA